MNHEKTIPNNLQRIRWYLNYYAVGTHYYTIGRVGVSEDRKVQDT